MKNCGATCADSICRPGFSAAAGASAAGASAAGASAAGASATGAAGAQAEMTRVKTAINHKLFFICSTLLFKVHSMVLQTALAAFDCVSASLHLLLVSARLE